jgi:hypothetical protein
MGNFAQFAAQKAAPAAAKVAGATTPAPAGKPSTGTVPKREIAAPAAKTAPPAGKTAPPAKTAASATPLAPGSTLSREERFSPGQAESARDAGVLGPVDTVALPSMSRSDSLTSYLMAQPTESDDMKFYREKMAAVKALREERTSGLFPLLATGYEDFKKAARKVTPPTTQAQSAPKTVTLRPSQAVDVPSLSNVMDFRRAAEVQGMKYRAARNNIGQLERMTPKLEARKDDQAPAARAQLAQMMRAEQQNLTDSLAGLREFGFDESEVSQKFK